MDKPTARPSLVGRLIDYKTTEDGSPSNTNGEVQLPSWNSVVHKTGWLNHKQKSTEGVEGLGSDIVDSQSQKDEEELEHETQLEVAQALVQKGWRRRPDTERNPALDLHDKKAFTTTAKKLKLRVYQAQMRQTLLEDYSKQGSGMVVGLEMGTGKTAIAISFIDALKRIPHTPHLIVVPLSLMEVWLNELKTWLNPKYKVCTYYQNTKSGTTTSYSPAELSEYDVVLATYEKVQLEDRAFEETKSQFSARYGSTEYYLDPKRSNMTLPVMKWHVVVFDEAHRLANASSSTTEAANRLSSVYRLPVTGTPFQNEYSDVQSLMRLLNVKPWAEAETFKRYFLFKNSKDNAAQLLASDINAILALSLRSFTLRLKTTDQFDGQPVADFKPGIVCPVKHKLTAQEEKAQKKTITIWDEEARIDHKAAQAAGTRGGGVLFEEVFSRITDARLTVVHPDCLKYRYGELGDEDFVLDEQNAAQSMDQIREAITSLATKRSTTAEKNRIALRASTKKTWNQSSRMVEFVRVVRNHFKDHKGKILVFSEFLSALDVGQNALEDHFGSKVRIGRYDATQDERTRAQLVIDFEENNKYNVFMMTSRCGGLGLTLIKANAVIHLTPTWNPHLAEQCTCRAVRIGQEKKVYVYNIWAPRSIERRVMLKQRQKRRKASKILDPDDLMLETMAKVADWSQDEFESVMEEAMAMSHDYAQKLKKRQDQRRKAKNQSPKKKLELKIEDTVDETVKDESDEEELIEELKKDEAELNEDDEDDDELRVDESPVGGNEDVEMTE